MSLIWLQTKRNGNPDCRNITFNVFHILRAKAGYEEAQNVNTGELVCLEHPYDTGWQEGDLEFGAEHNSVRILPSLLHYI